MAGAAAITDTGFQMREAFCLMLTKLWWLNDGSEKTVKWLCRTPRRHDCDQAAGVVERRLLKWALLACKLSPFGVLPP